MRGKSFIIGSTGIIGTQIKRLSNNDFNYVDRKDIDLSNFNNIKSFFQKFSSIDTLIFLVGLVHKRGKNGNFKQHVENNFKTLKNLILSLEKINILPNKIIFTSTVNVYGEKIIINHYPEELLAQPTTPYAKSKKMAEDYLVENHFERSWILRLSPVYSKTFKLNIDKRTKIFNLFYKVGGSETKFSLCNINNIVHCIDEIIDEKVPCGIYNLSDPIDYTYRDLLEYNKARFIVLVPKFIVKFFHKIALQLNFNSISNKLVKLISTNTYPSRKIRSFIKLSAKLYNDK